MNYSSVLNPREIAAALPDLWSPQIIGEVDETYIKVARVLGEFVWHEHQDEDELFYILAGNLRIEFAGKAIDLSAGDLYIVPKGERHRPVAAEECLILLIERKTTRHTGEAITPLTRSIAEQSSKPA